MCVTSWYSSGMTFLTGFLLFLASLPNNHHVSHRPPPRVRHLWCFVTVLQRAEVRVCEPTQTSCWARRELIEHGGAQVGQCAPTAVP